MQCFDKRLGELSARVKALSSADPEVVARAPTVAAGLSPVSSCADVKALRQPDPLPADPVRRAEIERLNQRLAVFYAEIWAGRGARAVPELERLVIAARAAGHAPVLADALYTLADARSGVERTPQAESELVAALAEAERARLDDVVALTAATLVWHIGSNPARGAEVRPWLEFARAAVDRLGKDDPMPAHRLAQAEGTLLEQAGDFAGARKAFERAVAIDEGSRVLADSFLGEDLLRLGKLSVNLGDDPEQVLPIVRRGLALEREALGEHHFLVGGGHASLAHVLRVAHRDDEARLEGERAIAIYRETYGVETVPEADTIFELAGVAKQAGKPREAAELVRRNLAILERHRGKDSPTLVGGLGELGDDLNLVGDHRGALAAAERAIAIVRKVQGDESPWMNVGLIVAGEARLGLGDAAGAVRDLERSLRLQEKFQPVPANLAETRFALARALWVLGERKRAREIAAVAEESYRAAPGAEKELKEVGEWRASHR
jgi:tetratricopeptide (TPR) repeat protein